MRDESCLQDRRRMKEMEKVEREEPKHLKLWGSWVQ